MLHRFTLTVPLADNDGAPVAPVVLEHFESWILEVAGGFTATDSIGAWRSDDGQEYRESVRVYAVDADESAEVYLREIAESVGETLRQEAVYLTRAPITAELIVPAVIA